MTDGFPTTTQISSTRGVSLALHHFGGNGPVLLVNHATGFHARCYLPMMPVLTAHFDVWGADFTGHGGSTLPADGEVQWDGFADDVLAVVDHLGVSDVRLFGHSMGGAASLLAATRRPELFTKAWVYEPIIFPVVAVERNSMMSDNALRRRRSFATRAEALHRYASRPPLGTMRADALAAYVEYGFHDDDDGSVSLACAPETEAATFASAGVTVEAIDDVDIPVIVAHGMTAAGPNPAEFAAPTAEALTNGQVVAYAGLSHFGPLQDPIGIATDVAAFLA